MDSGLITILDRDEVYARKLADYFRIKSGLDYDIQVFTSIDSLLKPDKTLYSDILILPYEYLANLSDINNSGSIFLLSEDMDLVHDEYPTIYKYQTCENLVRDVLSGYNSLPGTKRFSREFSKNSNIISVYSPIKRCGKTSFALTLGSLLSGISPSLYINLETFSGFSYFIDKEYKGDLTDLLYFFKSNPNELDKKLLSLTHTINRLCYIPPMRFSIDLKTLSGDELREFIKAIASTKRYRYIILDLSDSINDLWSIFNISSKVYIPSIKDQISQAKLSDFYRIMNITGKTDLSSLFEELYLPNEEDSLITDPLERLIIGNLGGYVQKLIRGGDFPE